MKNGYDAYRLKIGGKSSKAVCIAKGRGAVASVSREATELAIKALKDGGNAFDAAFTLAFALAICHPQAGNIGGGGYLIYKKRDSNKPVVINYREKSPAGTGREFYINKDGSINPDTTAFGPGSVCVPGTVKAFFTLQKRFGLLKARDILLYLSRVVEEGPCITLYQSQCLNRLAPKLAFSPESKRFYVKESGGFQEGDRLPNTHLSKTYIALAEEGERAFYEGKIAEQIEQDLTANGGFVKVEDLKNYTVEEVTPVSTEIMGKRIWSVPPEGGGAVLIEILNILGRDGFYRIKPFTSEYYHYMAQAFKMAFIDRFFYLGDIVLDDNKTYERIFKKEYTDNLFQVVRNRSDIKTEDLKQMMHEDHHSISNDDYPRGNQTTHFSVIDIDGNAVSSSYTLNLRYGSKWSVRGAGFLLNGSMDAFAFEPGKPNYFGVIGNEPNLFEPDKRPASNMSPVIVTDGEKVEMVIGTPGGPTIQTTLASIILSVLVNRAYPPDVIQMGRVHHQAWPDIFFKEENGIDPGILQELLLYGYKIEDKNEPIGDVHGIFAYEEGYLAISDFRREGYALSY